MNKKIKYVIMFLLMLMTCVFTLNVSAKAEENNTFRCVMVHTYTDYTGSVVRPAVNVYVGTTRVPSSGYTLTYHNDGEPGLGTVDVTGRNSYQGYSGSAVYRIVPPAVEISSVNTGNKSITFRWNVSHGADGYMLRISPDPSFKTITRQSTVNHGRATSFTMTNVNPGVYYARIVAFKTCSAKGLSGTRGYSSWKTYRDEMEVTSGKEGFYYENGKYVYYRNGSILKGWQTISGRKYWFLSSDGRMVINGFTTWRNNKYYFGSDGVMLTNKKNYVINGVPYNIDSTGIAYPVGRDFTYNGMYATVERQGDGTSRIKRPDNSYVKDYGFCVVNKGVYFVSDSTGTLASGWVNYGGKTYYFDPSTHIAVQGLVKIDGENYYFLGTERTMHKGFMNFGSVSSRRYFGSDGKMGKGWITIGSDKYFSDSSTGYLKMNSIVTIGGSKYYFDADGKLVTNKMKYAIDGVLYDIDSDGKLSMSVDRTEVMELSGRVEEAVTGVGGTSGDNGNVNGPHILKADGTVAIGPQVYKIDDNLYFVKDSKGILATGWFEYGGARYYADPSSYALVRGLKKIGGDYYYFLGQTGKMNIGFMKFGSNGVMRYFGPDGKMVTGWQRINGNTYYFSNGQGMMARNEIIDLNGKQYYFKNDGTLVTNQSNYVIDGNTYNIDQNGVLTVVLQNDEYEVLLCGNDGSIYKRVGVKKGSSYSLPGMPNPTGATFMGWSTTPNVFVTTAGYTGKIYEVQEDITVNSNVKFYAVLFRDSDDIDIDQNNLPALSDRYAALIVVGDSRQNYIREYTSDYRRTHPNVMFIAKGGTRYDWMSGTAYPQLVTMIQDIRKTSDKPIAVLFNHGINDLRGTDIVIDPYISFMNKIAPELLSYNCRLFYMSANPSNPVEMAGRFDRMTNMDAVREFNARIRSQLNDYTFIDMYSMMMRYGYKSYDGLHYSAASDRRYFSMYMKMINSMS